jgi:hypothetical protein
MNEENTSKLLSDFPALYRDAVTKPGERLSCMTQGFSTGDGWFQLIYALSSAIEKEARATGLTPDSKAWPKALQVKEKFGTLCFYVSTGNRDDKLEPEMRGAIISFRPIASNANIRALIDDAEKQSGQICETCGLAGEMRRDGWWRVSCDSCEAKRQEGN